MTTRERVLNILNYEPCDRLPAVHFGYWPELLAEWANQGKISSDLAESWYDGGPADRELDKIHAQKAQRQPIAGNVQDGGNVGR